MSDKAQEELDRAITDIGVTIMSLRRADEEGQSVPTSLRAHIRVMENEWFNVPTEEGARRRELLAELGRDEREAAITLILEARNTHMMWKRHLEMAQSCCDRCREWAADAIKAGVDNIEHHERYIVGYGRILELLRNG